jgi:hypothetical protein
MRNGKEVLVLIILIFVVLVSTAKAQDDNLSLRSVDDESSIIAFAKVDVNSNVEINEMEFRTEKRASVEIGVDVPSAMSDDPDEYGLVVTLKALF